jgi:phosphoribosylformylglycinamidine synthase
MEVPTVEDACYFAAAFTQSQELVEQGLILAGHDVSAGGLITTLLEMLFADNHIGMEADLNSLGEKDWIRVLFAENPAVVIQVKNDGKAEEVLKNKNITYYRIGKPSDRRILTISLDGKTEHFNPDILRDVWFKTSYLLDRKQSGNVLARERFESYKKIELNYIFTIRLQADWLIMGWNATGGMQPESKQPLYAKRV